MNKRTSLSHPVQRPHNTLKHCRQTSGACISPQIGPELQRHAGMISQLPSQLEAVRRSVHAYLSHASRGSHL